MQKREFVDRTGQLWWRGPFDQSLNKHFAAALLVIGPPRLPDGVELFIVHPVIIMKIGGAGCLCYAGGANWTEYINEPFEKLEIFRLLGEM